MNGFISKFFVDILYFTGFLGNLSLQYEFDTNCVLRYLCYAHLTFAPHEKVFEDHIKINSDSAQNIHLLYGKLFSFVSTKFMH